MLTLTENATTIVKSIAAQSESETAGLRISADGQPEESFAVEAVNEGRADDQLVEQDGARVFLDATANAQLDDKVLDAGVDGEGNVQFGLAQQA